MLKIKWPFVHWKIYKKIAATPCAQKVITTRSRSTTITPNFVGWQFDIHNGRLYFSIKVSESMVGHKLGEFIPTRKFGTHKFNK
jgi:small subunit ribosomal protein S19